MKFKHHPPKLRDEGELIASFGEARLVKYLDGRCELRGGSKEDRLEAKDWISKFFRSVVVREV